MLYTYLWQMCITLFLMFYTFPANSQFQTHCFTQVSEKFHSLLCCRFCKCMLHEQFTRWLSTLHKIILAHHDENCECDCVLCGVLLCSSCYAHPRYAFMGLPLLCLTGIVSRTSTCLLLGSLSVRCLACCMTRVRLNIGCMNLWILQYNLPQILLLAQQCKVRLFSYFFLYLLTTIVNPNSLRHSAKDSCQSQVTKSTKAVFCQHMFNSMPHFFLHHQIDLTQRDRKKMLLSMLTAVSRLLCLDFDCPENHTHINQVLFVSHSSVDYLRHTLTVPFVHFIVGTLQLMSHSISIICKSTIHT